MANNILMNGEFFEDLAGYVYKKTELDAEPQDLQIAIKAALEYVAVTLANNKSETEEVVAELPGYLSFKVGYRKGDNGGNFGLGIVAGEELKKRIKDDELDEVLDDSEE